MDFYYLFLLACAVCLCQCSDTPNPYEIYLQGQHSQYTLHDPSTALYLYNKAHEIISLSNDNIQYDYSGMYNDIGVLRMNSGELELAAEAFQMAISLNDQCINAYSNLAGLKAKFGDFNGAEYLYRVAIGVSGAPAELYYNYGVFLVELGRLEEAKDMYKAALQRKNDLVPALGALALESCREGNWTAANEFYEIAKVRAHMMQDTPTYNSLVLQQALGVIPHFFVSKEQADDVRRTYLRNLYGAIQELPIDSIVSPIESLGCSSIGYYLIYQGYNDLIPRQLLAFLYSRVSLTYIYDYPASLNLPAFNNVVQQPHISRRLYESVCTEPSKVVRSDDRIKVGFMSAFFYHHSVGLLLQGVIKNIRSDLFHKTLILIQRGSDDVTEKLIRSCDITVRLDQTRVSARDLQHHRQRIRSYDLDVLVFGEIGMDTMTYFLSFSQLARRSIVFWGHAITSGVLDYPSLYGHLSNETGDGGCWSRGGPDYFVSSVLFEKNRSQLRYTERLLLQEGMTTYFERPLPPLRYDVLGLPPLGAHDSQFASAPPGLSWRATLPDKMSFLNLMLSSPSHAIEKTVDNVEHHLRELGLNRSDVNLYGVPQTLYKLSPTMTALIARVLLSDPHGLLVIPDGQDGTLVRIAKSLMRKQYGESLFHRVLFVRTMTGQEFITLCAVFDVVLDTFPVGGGGMYETMGITCDHCITYSEDDFVRSSVAVASNRTLQTELRQKILSNNYRLYENASVIEEWNDMLLYVANSPRPMPFQDESVKHHIVASVSDRDIEHDIKNLKKYDFVDSENVTAIDLALSVPFSEPAVRLKDCITSRTAIFNNKDYSQPNDKGSSLWISNSHGKHQSRDIPTPNVTVAVGFILGYSPYVKERKGHTVRDDEVSNYFASAVRSVEAALGHNIPGGNVKEVLAVDDGLSGFTAAERIALSTMYPRFTFVFESTVSRKGQPNQIRAGLNALNSLIKLSTSTPPYYRVKMASFGLNFLNGAIHALRSFEFGSYRCETMSCQNETVVRQAAHIVLLKQQAHGERSKSSENQYSFYRSSLDLCNRVEEYLASVGRYLALECPGYPMAPNCSGGYMPSDRNISSPSRDTTISRQPLIEGYMESTLKFVCDGLSASDHITSFCAQVYNYSHLNTFIRYHASNILNHGTIDEYVKGVVVDTMRYIYTVPSVWDIDALAHIVLDGENQYRLSSNYTTDRKLTKSDFIATKRSSKLHTSAGLSKSKRRVDWKTHRRAAVVFDREDAVKYVMPPEKSSFSGKEWDKYHSNGGNRFALRLLSTGVRIAYFARDDVFEVY